MFLLTTTVSYAPEPRAGRTPRPLTWSAALLPVVALAGGCVDGDPAQACLQIYAHIVIKVSEFGHHLVNYEQ